MNLVFGLGMSRYGLALSESSQDAMKIFDQGFSRGITSIKELGLRYCLEKVGSFFGWIALIYLMFFFIGKVIIGDGEWQLYGSLITIWAVVIWASIKWFISFQKYALKFLVDSIKLFSTILIMPIFDFVGKLNMTEMLYNLVSNMNTISLGLALPNVDNTIYQAVILFIFYVAMILAYWVISSVYFGLIAGMSLGVVGSVVYFARFLDRHWSRNHLTGFFVIGFVITSVALWFG